MGQGRPGGREDRSPIFYYLELIEDFKIVISRNALLHWNEIFRNFLNMYTFFRFDEGKVCLWTCKVNASAQEIGKISDLASLTSTFEQVLAGFLNLSFKKSFMRSLSRKQKNIYIF